MDQERKEVSGRLFPSFPLFGVGVVFQMEVTGEFFTDSPNLWEGKRFIFPCAILELRPRSDMGPPS